MGLARDRAITTELPLVSAFRFSETIFLVKVSELCNAAEKFSKLRFCRKHFRSDNV